MGKFCIRELIKLMGCSSQAEINHFVSLVDPLRAFPRDKHPAFALQISDMMVETDHAREIIKAYISWKISDARREAS